MLAHGGFGQSGIPVFDSLQNGIMFVTYAGLRLLVQLASLNTFASDQAGGEGLCAREFDARLETLLERSAPSSPTLLPRKAPRRSSG